MAQRRMFMQPNKTIQFDRGKISVGESKKKRHGQTLKRRYITKRQRYKLGQNLDQGGYVPLYRVGKLSELRKKPKLWDTWTRILHDAPWTKREVNVDGQIITLNPGQFEWNDSEFAASWNIPRTTLQRCVAKLQTLKLLTVEGGQSWCISGQTLVKKRANFGKLLTICNYEEMYCSQKYVRENSSDFVQSMGSIVGLQGRKALQVDDIKDEKPPLINETLKKEYILCLNKPKHESEPPQESPPKDPIKPVSSPTKAPPKRRSKKDYPEYNEIFKEYPERDGSHGVLKTLVDKVTKITNKGRLEELKSAIANYREYCIDKDKEGTEFVMQFCTFLTSRTKGWEAWINPNGDQPNSSPSKKMTYEENFRYGHIAGAFE
jgi:hypothetical protein